MLKSMFLSTLLLCGSHNAAYAAAGSSAESSLALQQAPADHTIRLSTQFKQAALRETPKTISFQNLGTQQELACITVTPENADQRLNIDDAFLLSNIQTLVAECDCQYCPIFLVARHRQYMNEVQEVPFALPPLKYLIYTEQNGYLPITSIRFDIMKSEDPNAAPFRIEGTIGTHPTASTQVLGIIDITKSALYNKSLLTASFSAHNGFDQDVYVPPVIEEIKESSIKETTYMAIAQYLGQLRASGVSFDPYNQEQKALMIQILRQSGYVSEQKAKEYFEEMF